MYLKEKIQERTHLKPSEELRHNQQASEKNRISRTPDWTELWRGQVTEHLLGLKDWTAPRKENHHLWWETNRNHDRKITGKVHEALHCSILAYDHNGSLSAFSSPCFHQLQHMPATLSGVMWCLLAYTHHQLSLLPSPFCQHSNMVWSFSWNPLMPPSRFPEYF